MLSTGHMSKYWAFTAIALCVLYVVFHLSNSEVLPFIPKSSRYDQGVGASRARVDMDADEGRHLAQALQSTFTPSQSYPARFPRTIWQAWLGPDEHGHEKFAERTETWKKVKSFEHKILKGKRHDYDIDEGTKRLQKSMLWHSLRNTSRRGPRLSISGKD